MIRNIAVISPGDMGHSVGRVLAEHGFNIFTCLEGRSERTINLAHAAQFKILNNYKELVEQSDLIMSILPPDHAYELVDKIANILESSNREQIYFADCNAISPFKSISLAEKIILEVNLLTEALLVYLQIRVMFQGFICLVLMLMLWIY